MNGNEGAVASGAAGLALVAVWLAFVVFGILVGWRIFAKAGQPGWACIIPIYNVIVLLRIVGRPWWWLLLYLIPVVNLIIGILVTVDLAKSFGKGAGFAVGMILLGFIFYPILAFGSATYQGPAAQST